MKRFSIPFFLILGLVQWSFSQSEFLTRDHSGYGGGFGLSTNRQENGLNFYAGYSYRGFLNAKLTYSKANGERFQDGILSPSITFYPIKQEDARNAPTVGISLGYSRYKTITTSKFEEQDTGGVIGWHWREITEEKTINALKLGVTAQRRLGYWKAFFFQPLLGAGFSNTNAGLEFTLRGGLSIGSRVVRGPLLILTPSIERQSGLTTLMLTFSAVF
jgi:hypothetical protein